MTTLFENLLDNSIELIRQYLPEEHEMDDIAWAETDDIFQIPIFDVSEFPGRLECGERWQREINAFNNSWIG